MKNKKIIIIVLISLAVFIVFGVASCTLASRYADKNGGINFDTTLGGMEDSQQAEVSLDGVEFIEISGRAEDIHFIESDSDLTSDLYISSFRKTTSVTLSSYVKGNTAYIEVTYPNTNISINVGRLTVGLPADFAGEITVESMSGDVDANMKNSLSALSISTMSGDAKMVLDSVGDFSFSSVSGGLTLDTVIEKSVSAETTSGNLEIASLAGSNAVVNIKSISGDIALSYATACPTSINTTSGHTHVSLLDDSAINLDFSSVSGAYRGNAPTSQSGVAFNITSVSGDLSFE